MFFSETRLVLIHEDFNIVKFSVKNNKVISTDLVRVQVIVKTIPCRFTVSITMPKRGRANIGRRSQSNARRSTSRANRTDDQRATDNENSRIGMSQLRSRATEDERQANRFRMQQVRAHQTQRQRAQHNEHDRLRRRDAPINLERAAFHYDSEIDYSADRSVTIGEMSVVCPHCKALKFSGETPGLCCAGGKVKLPQLVPPPEPLRSLVQLIFIYIDIGNVIV